MMRRSREKAGFCFGVILGAAILLFLTGATGGGCNCTRTACDAFTPELTANDGWNNSAAATAAHGSVDLEFLMRAGDANIDGGVAIANQAVSDFANAVMLVRFNNAGTIDVRDGANYGADATFPYVAGAWYHVAIEADVSARSYTVRIGAYDGPLQTLITDAAFRSGAPAAGGLTHVALWSSQAASVEMTDLVWTVGACVPKTCESLGHVCGVGSDGCGKLLPSCGNCGDDETCVAGSCITPGTSGTQKWILENIPWPETRFDITELVWPRNHGEADVCLWEDDKIAAFTVTIDDNAIPDHDIWIAAGHQYNLKFTWFINDWYLDEDDWDKFLTLANLGHDIQSHGHHHQNTDFDYRVCKENISARMPEPCKTLAYPGTPPGDLDAPNDVATKYYHACRGTSCGANRVNATHYNKTKSCSGFQRDYIDYTLHKTQRFEDQYRGWASHHAHGVSAADVQNMLEFLKAREDRLWIGRYTDVALYGQERDTHTLTVKEVTASQISFALTDLMLDSAFDYPLTVKVRVNNNWQTVTARQNSVSVDAKLITHNGDKYVLVKAVPDKGDVVLTNSLSPSGSR